MSPDSSTVRGEAFAEIGIFLLDDGGNGFGIEAAAEGDDQPEHGRATAASAATRRAGPLGRPRADRRRRRRAGPSPPVRARTSSRTLRPRTARSRRTWRATASIFARAPEAGQRRWPLRQSPQNDVPRPPAEPAGKAGDGSVILESRPHRLPRRCGRARAPSGGRRTAPPGANRVERMLIVNGWGRVEQADCARRCPPAGLRTAIHQPLNGRFAVRRQWQPEAPAREEENSLAGASVCPACCTTVCRETTSASLRSRRRGLLRHRTRGRPR